MMVQWDIVRSRGVRASYHESLFWVQGLKWSADGGEISNHMKLSKIKTKGQYRKVAERQGRSTRLLLMELGMSPSVCLHYSGGGQVRWSHRLPYSNYAFSHLHRGKCA